MTPRVPMVGPTAAFHGRAGGPGFPVKPGAVSGLYDPAQRSGWQLAQGLWEQSGIAWEPPAGEPRPEPAWHERDGSPGPSWPAGGYGQEALAPPDIPAPPADEWRAGTRWADSGRSSAWQGGDWRPDDGQPADWQGADADGQAGPWQTDRLPLGAAAPYLESAPGSAPGSAPAPTPAYVDADTPTRPDWPTQPRPGPPPLPARWADGDPAGGREPGESDELFRAWQGSVHRASAAGRPMPRVTAARRHQVWQVLRVGVPVAVLATVGAGAVMMLTGKTGGMLDSRASQRGTVPGSGPAFAGYPGQHGAVTVNSIATAGGSEFGVGSADGHPAIWRHGANGAWTLISASSPAVYQRPGTESLTSVAHGAAGWIAVGGVVSGTAQQPVVVTSSDGVTWHAADGAAAFTAPGTFVTGVTASQNGYVVVGKHVSGGRTFAAMWWSADLRNWVGGSNGGLDGRLAPSTVYAVGATTTGFVAAGTHGGCHTIWTSADGRNWSAYDVPKPRGATNALLSQVAVNGTRVVTAGYLVGKGGDMPVVVASTDGGTHWRQILLPAPAGLGSVTRLTAAGNGFVAAGLGGPAGARHAVTWSSPDGLTWSAAMPVSLGQITALSASGGTVFGTAQRGADPAVLTFAAP